VEEREAVAEQTKLLAFDKQNHMGASHKSAQSLSKAIQRETELMLNDKGVLTGTVNIQTNADSIKVPSPPPPPPTTTNTATTTTTTKTPPPTPIPNPPRWKWNWAT